MFSGTTFVLIHTGISLAAIVAGFPVMAMLLKNGRPGLWTAIFLVFAIATTVTGFMFPFTGLTPAFITGLVASALFIPALLAQFVFGLAGIWRRLYAFSMAVNVYLLLFVLVVQSFLNVPVLHALAPNAPAQPEPAFAAAQGLLLLAFVFLTWKSVRTFGRPAAV